MAATGTRPEGRREQQYRFGEFTLDLDSGSLRREDASIYLRPKTFEVLVCLVERHGKLVTREELATTVWADVVVTDNSLSQCIAEIRRALQDDDQQTVRTVARRGYLFAAPLRPHALSPEDGPAPATRAIARATFDRRRVGLIGALLVALVGGAILVREIGVSAVTRPSFTPITDFTDSAVAPVLSPDGRMVAFIRDDRSFLSGGQIWVKLLPNGEPVQLTNDPRPKFAPAFSPDGSRVAYSVAEPSGWNTYTVPSLGGEPRLWLQNASGLTWAAHERLLFSTQKGTIHMGIVTATPSRTEPRDVYWPSHERGMAHFSYASPDGKWALIVEMDHRPDWLPCRLVSLDGSSAGSQVGPSGQCTSAAWSPDGKWMYLGVENDGYGQLWRQRFPNGAPEQITFGPTEAAGVTVAPDGRSLITSIGAKRGALWIHDRHGDRPLSTEGTVASLTSSFAGSLLGWSSVPSFSRDGKYVYYLHRRQVSAPGFRLWRTDLDSQTSEEVVEWPVVEYDVSADGAEVVFSTADDSGSTQVWLARTDKASAPKQIASGDVATPQFGRDDEVLFRLTKGTSNYLFRMKADGSQREQVAPFPIATLQTVSPDGRWAVAILPENGKSYLVPTDGSPPVRVCDGGCYALWAADGSFLYVRIQQSNQTLAIPLAADGAMPAIPPGGIPPLADENVIPGSTVLNVAEIVPGPDPSTYAYVKPSVNRNLVRISLR